MKKILLGVIGLAAVGMSAPASAADLAARPYTKAPPPMVAAVYDWTGFYIGANGGLGSSRKCWSDITALAVAEVGLWLGLLGAPLWASKRKGAGDLATDFGFSFRWSDPLVGLPIGVVCQLLLVPLIYLPLQQFVDQRQLEEPVRKVTDSAHGGAFRPRRSSAA